MYILYATNNGVRKIIFSPKGEQFRRNYIRVRWITENSRRNYIAVIGSFYFGKKSVGFIPEWNEEAYTYIKQKWKSKRSSFNNIRSGQKIRRKKFDEKKLSLDVVQVTRGHFKVSLYYTVSLHSRSYVRRTRQNSICPAVGSLSHIPLVTHNSRW